MEGLTMRNFLSLLLAIVCSLAVNSPADAQSGKGTIIGTVKDSGNSALQSALVELLPLGRKVVTDDHGQFRITDVLAGEYTLNVSYVGLAVSNVPVVVQAGQETNANPVLQVASQVDQVIVSAERLQGEAEAINIERTAENIVQVLPSKVITSLPNTNIADAVGRLPSVTLERDEGEGKYVQIRGTEPRLSNVTINGVNVPSPESNVRNIKLDVIPADLVDRIEVNKTLSANQDADAIGGSVNLVTKSPGERPTISFAGLGGYTPIQGGRSLYAFCGALGQRFGADKKLGALLGLTYDHNNRGIDDIEPSQTAVPVSDGTPTGTRNIAVVNGLDTREYQYYRSRYGFAGGLDYRLSPGSSAYIRGLFSDFHDFGTTSVYSYNPGTALTQSGAVTTFDNTGNMQYRQYIRRPDQQIYSFSTGARHDLSSTLITYEFAVSRSHQIGGFPTTYFNGPGNSGPAGVAFNLDTTDPYRPKLSVQNGGNIFDPTAYSISQVLQVAANTTQLNFQGTASLGRRYTAGSHLGTFELGLKVRNAHKTYNVLNSYFNNNYTNLTLAQGLSTFSNPNYYDKSYQLGPISDYTKLQNIFASNPSAFTLNLSKTR
jgi:TonB-dependent receptor